MAETASHNLGRIDGLQALQGRYDALFCDVWGVLHNGVAVYKQADHALSQFRTNGGRVIMITNSPRPRAGVVAQLKELGASPEVYDDIVTSGDVTRDLIRQVAGDIFHLGPNRDAPLFDGLSVKQTTEQKASAFVCTGLFNDEVETPDDYADRFVDPIKRGVPFICANPDIVVERGDRLIWCAGSLAQLYQRMGGEVRLAGKPHKPIYELAMKKLAALTGSPADQSRVIAIGDGIPTDVAGALGNGFDLLYITAGIHAGDYVGEGGSHDMPDEGKLSAFLAENDAIPTAWIPRLTWGHQQETTAV